MKKLTAIIAVLLFLLIITAHAQTKPAIKPDTLKLKSGENIQTEKFKKNDSAYRSLSVTKRVDQAFVDSTDLQLKNCEFEKEANSMIIYDKAIIGFNTNKIAMARFRRIKIFNDNGKGDANIRIEYDNKFGEEHILAVIAQTINFNNGKVEYTKLDSTLIYNEHTNKQKDAVVFTMPNVKAGSVIEYGYAWGRNASRNFPDWYFQNKLPTAYSEINIVLNPFMDFTQLTYINQPFNKDTTTWNGRAHTWAMKNVPSSKNEPYMRSAVDGVQRISLIIKSVRGFYGPTKTIADSWATIGKQLADSKEFTKPLEQNINDENGFVDQAKKLKTQDEKIEFLFNRVQTAMKYNEDENWFSKDGIKSAWKKKTGNASEINMILCHLLKQSGIKAYPLLVSTRKNGLIYSNFANLYQINRVIVYVPVDSTNYYAMDASDKYNFYNQVPFDFLNSAGLCLDKEKEKYNIVYLSNNTLVKHRVSIDADIKPDGTLTGTARVSDFSYNKSSFLEMHKEMDEDKYKQYLTDNDNNLKITSLKLENADVDSLPLVQNINFNLELSATDDNYIYFTPNLFTGLHNNPFISSTRVSNIDFGCKNLITLNGRFKMPPGYKVYLLPKSITLVTPDKDITFKRLVEQEEDYIVVYYVITYKQSLYLKDEYEILYPFYKKMYEMLNEQIVLKKS